MKTYKGNNITKKKIQSIIRTMDPTQIFRLYHNIYGKVERMKVYNFIKEFAPTEKVAHAAWDIAYSNKHQQEKGVIVRRSIEFHNQNAKHIAIQVLRDEIARGLDSYSKRPIMGHTHLYFASPVHLHSDYNKWCAMPIKGNEKFCETICRLADKYFPIAK